MIRLTNIEYRYSEEKTQPSIRGLNLTIAAGELVVLCGESGCGKTTLTRVINGLIPHFYEGELSGEIAINGKDPRNCTIQEMAEIVGSVFQNPRSQFFSTNTTAELAFGCENAGVAKEVIIERIEEVNRSLKFSSLLDRNIFQLSGGEKQKIACGSVSVTDNDIYVLDEPSSNLDLQAIEDLKNQLIYWKSKGKTIIIAEHRLHYLKDLVDRMIYMEKGAIVHEFSKEEIAKLSTTHLNQLGLRSIALEQLEPERPLNESKEQLVLKDFTYAYKYQSSPALTIAEASIPKGCIAAIVGLNGAGKSTFARCFCGLEKQCKGQLLVDGTAYSSKQRLKKSYMVMQDVNHQLFTESVLDEILLSMKQKDEAQAIAYLKQLDIDVFAERHPLSLSGGQKQRVAIASALASEREWLIFDEPTSGLDFKHMEGVADCLIQLAQLGKTVFVISHDFELIAKCCDVYLQLAQGQLADVGSLTKERLESLKSLFVS